MVTSEKKREKLRQSAAQVAKLSDLVSYQKGSVVSRTLVDERAGTVTLFAFDDGEGLSEHTAPYDALVYLIEGEAEITISGKAFHLKAGEMIIIPSKEPHSLKALTGFKMVLTMMRSR
jgi:quercetin dioxygenase-like cupin family protein